MSTLDQTVHVCYSACMKHERPPELTKEELSKLTPEQKRERLKAQMRWSSERRRLQVKQGLHSPVPRGSKRVEGTYFSRNKEARLAYQRDYRTKNREHVRNRSADYERRRYHGNPQVRLQSRMGAMLSQALRGGRVHPDLIDALGCDLETFKAHIEAQFCEGMSWANRGLHGWHVDHIRPLTSFDLFNPVQFHEAYHFTNTQPLWRVDNLRKGAAVDMETGSRRGSGYGKRRELGK